MSIRAPFLSLLLFSLLLGSHSSPDDSDLTLTERPSGIQSPPTDPLTNDSKNADTDDLLDWDFSESPQPSFDEKDVVVLTGSSFDVFVSKNRFAVVEFYAPWCSPCQLLAPEYAAAATELKGGAVLAKVDATEETDLANKYGVEGYPTIFLFVDGERRVYKGARNKDSIVDWVRNKTSPVIRDVITVEEAERILKSESRMVAAFLDTLTGADSKELEAASRIEDDITFYRTANSDVAQIFQIDPNAARPSLVVLKDQDEKISYYDGPFSKSHLAEFVSFNKAPHVINFTRQSSSFVFSSPVKKQILLFSTSSDSAKLMPSFREAAKEFKGKLIFIYVDIEDDDSGKSVSTYFGVTGTTPQVLAYTGNEDGRKFLLNGNLTLDSIKSFAKDFLEDLLVPLYKSEPVPERNDGDVKIVVGRNFDDIVLDESKDVLLELYSPTCPHCIALEPIYSKLAKYLRGIDSIVIAKMDGLENEHPRAKPDGFPTILFFPAGNKSFDPITFDDDRTVVALYKFLKKHASIPFKIQKPAPNSQSEGSDHTKPTTDAPAGSNNVKDEL